MSAKSSSLLNFRVRYYRAIIISFELSDFLNDKSPIYYLYRKRLIYNFSFIVLKYNKKSTALTLKHMIKEKLDKLEDN